jgi:hypothetical protein
MFFVPVITDASHWWKGKYPAVWWPSGKIFFLLFLTYFLDIIRDFKVEPKQAPIFYFLLCSYPQSDNLLQILSPPFHWFILILSNFLPPPIMHSLVCPNISRVSKIFLLSRFPTNFVQLHFIMLRHSAKMSTWPLYSCSCSYFIKKVKLSLQQAVEAHRVVKRRGSHIF